MEFDHFNGNESSSNKWLWYTAGTLAAGGLGWYLWLKSPIKARYDVTTLQMCEISKGFRRELFDYHLMFYHLARDYILMREELGRPVQQQAHMTTEEISQYLENSSIAKEYARKRIEIIKRVMPNLSLNQFLVKSDELIKLHIKLSQENQQAPEELVVFYRSFYFEAVFLDGQTISIGYIQTPDTPPALTHRVCLQIFSNYIFTSLKELTDFYEATKNMNYDQKKRQLQELTKNHNKMLWIKQQATELVGGQEAVDPLSEDIRLYVIKLAHDVSDEFEGRYNISDVNKLNNSYSAISFNLVDAILKKQHTDFYFQSAKEKIPILIEASSKFELEINFDFGPEIAAP